MTGENTVFTLLFADDQLLIADDYEDLEYTIRKLRKEYKWDVKINMKKTKFVVLNQDLRNLVLEEQGETIKDVKSMDT